ncbi:MAG: D-2-hydroxyacid dehydrogenase [Chloroflexota bacterium]
MDKVNVLVVSRLNFHPTFLKDIAAVDPRVSVKDAVKQFVDEMRKKGSKDVNLARLEQEIKVTPSSPGDFDKLLSEAEVILGSVMFPENLLKRAPKLKWVHIANVGIDRYVAGTDLFKGNITVTNSRGGVAVPIAEQVLTFMCMLAKNAPRLMADKEKRVWDRFITMELQDRVVGLVGLGAIASEVVRVAKGVGMKVIATKRSATRRQKNVDGVDELYPLKELHQMIHDSDFLVIAAPLTDETRGMIGEAELRAMKPTAFLINIARGPIVNEPVLIRALKEKWIAGAGLDVFQTEPLPPESELWGLPNVVMSSHMAGSSDRRSQRLIKLFCDDLKLYLAGKPLFNVVNLEKGY